MPTDIPDEVEDSPTAVSTADPHLTTFDRGRYSFMGVGEFVAAKSTGDNFLVQVRQSPYPNSTQVSVNTGVAVQTGSDVVCVYAPNQLYVNRQAVPLTFTDYALANGGSLRYQRNRLTIKNANGDVVEVQLLGADLDYFITPAKNRKGKLSGILGNYDGNPQNDIAKADGQVLRNDYSALYPAFADSWRIKDTESLFFYDAGKNTNSYTDKAFPRSEVQLTAAQSADAERICRQAGVTDPAALQGCIVDVALTGNRGFADRAKENEVVSGAKTTLSVSNFAQYRSEFVLGSGGTINGNTAVLPSKGTIRWSDAYLNRDGYETEVVLAVNAPSPCFPLFDLEVVDLQNAGLQNFLRLSTNNGRTQVELVNSGVQPQFHPVNVFDGNRHRIKINTYKVTAGVNTILQLEVRIDNYEPLLIRNVYATASLAGYLYPTLKSETLNCTTGQTTIYGWSFRSR
ncbi:VWD domain-containing protein [Spirosoma arcticum]